MVDTQEEEEVLPSADWQLDYESDNADWTFYGTDNNIDHESDSDSNSGVGDQQEGQRDNSEHATDSQSEGDNQEQHTRTAAARLKMAWHKLCSCGM